MNDEAITQQPNILLVDDQSENLLALQETLSGADANLVVAKSGQDALRELMRLPFAVVILDVQMPDMDGYEVASLMRENEATKNIPIIFVTAINKEDSHVFKGYDSGAVVDYLFKPIDARLLRSKVSVFLTLDRQARLLHSMVTELRQSQRELKAEYAALAEKNEQLDQFAYSASHDLQAPIRHLIAFSEILVGDASEGLNEDVKSHAEYIAKTARRMNDLVRDLLNFARIGRSALKAVAVDLNDCVDEAIDALSQQIKETGAEVHRDSLPQVTGDPRMLTLVYQNLLENATKFVRDGHPIVHLDARREGENWVLGVRDNGIGIAPEDAKRIFQPFERLGGSSESRGTGIGLAICKKTVQFHGGDLTVNSVLGEGANFQFTLPAARDATS